MQGASTHVRESLVQDSRAGEGQELSRALVAKRSFGAEPEDAFVADLSALRISDPSPLGHMCPQLQILILRSNMIVKLPGAQPAATRVSRDGCQCADVRRRARLCG
jgi:hypothetical protein